MPGLPAASSKIVTAENQEAGTGPLSMVPTIVKVTLNGYTVLGVDLLTNMEIEAAHCALRTRHAF